MSSYWTSRRTALKIPGVTVTEETTNLNGGPGMALGHVSSTGHIRQELIFSKSDYQYIGQRQVLVEPGGRSEHIVNSGSGWTVLSPATGQATVWTRPRDEARRWARSLLHETSEAPTPVEPSPRGLRTTHPRPTP